MNLTKDADRQDPPSAANNAKIANVQIRKAQYLAWCEYKEPRVPEYTKAVQAKSVLERAAYISVHAKPKMDEINLLGRHESHKSVAFILNGNEPAVREGTGPGNRAVSRYSEAIYNIFLGIPDVLKIMVLCDDLPNVDSTTIALSLLERIFFVGTDSMPVPTLKEKPTYRKILDMIVACIKAHREKQPVWLVLECIESIEDRDRREGTMQLFKTLVEASRDQSQKYPFSFLVTCGTEGECTKYARSKKVPMYEAPKKLPKPKKST
ncbi:uncharacterized protein LTR77_007293 [Saxophila tyrrhenica]|uniref:Uncharacterized protein n=1 Tax=Saxophila tyrrhenica TaxID=1690608 RepID=A0AAV9P456_9PEZI|nr:hypothetical protein LTR77_007293 [Saxophila tyrrhenica]